MNTFGYRHARAMGIPTRRRRRVVTRANSKRAHNLAPPSWVDEVVAEVRDLMGFYSKRLLILWRQSPTSKLSSGHTKVKAGEIVITAGSCEWDQGDTLLHELAHWLLPRGVNHRLRFWRLYWQLIDHFGLDRGKALQRAEAYRKRAAVAFTETSL